MLMSEFVEANRITIRSVPLLGRDDVQGWKDANHYQIAIDLNSPSFSASRRKTFLTLYSMGSAHKGTPKLVDVLDSLRSDCTIADDNPYYSQYVREFGEEPGGLDCWKACRKTAERLQEFFGFSSYRTFIGCDAE